MSVDPNVYALSIQLSLESSAAFATLEEFGQKASDIESNISTAAQNSIKSTEYLKPFKTQISL